MENYLKYDSFIDAVRINENVGAESVMLTCDVLQKCDCEIPPTDAPVVGVLFDQRANFYQVDMRLVRALTRVGLNVMFLKHHAGAEQLRECKALVVPDGSFLIPDDFCCDSAKRLVSNRFAYIKCISCALELNLPILGINKGALLVAGLMKMVIYHSVGNLPTPIRHYSADEWRHTVNIFEQTPLFDILDGQNSLKTNSQHVSVLAPVRIQREYLAETNHLDEKDVKFPLDIYAETNDGIPEAWGSEKRCILCVQWNPELMLVQGYTLMLKIFGWLASQINR